MKIKITVLLTLTFFFSQKFVFGQSNCGPSTPTYTVDLTGTPNGTWISPVIVRDDTCCGATHPDACVQFVITLDTAAQGIAFDIYSGSVPPGAMYYQINCGPSIAVGSPICLQTPGPHYLTFCKPGNNANEYSITSLSTPLTKGDTMAMGCTGGMVSASGYHEPSITWTSIFPGPQGAYDSYLSCTSGCDTAIVSPLPNSPPYVDYMICGFSATLCDTVPICDTVRVYIFSTLQATISGTSVLCNGTSTGSLSANVSGGALPYAYSWSNGSTGQSINGLTPGTYSVTVTDGNGCFVSSSFTIVQPAPLATGVSQTDALCFGDSNGTAAVSVSGGTAPYTYFWSSCGCTTSAITGLSAGAYFVTITDQNGCSVNQNITIGQPSQLVFGISSTSNVTCFGGANGAAATTVSGGTVPYSYSWSSVPSQTTSGASGLSAGNYTVMVTDANGCTGAATCTITEPPVLSSVMSSVPATCFGSLNGSASVAATGGSQPYTYLWNPGGATSPLVTGVSAGMYSVTVTDNYGCTHINTVSVTQPPALNASIINVQHVSCFNLGNGSANASVNGGTAPYLYSWTNGQTSVGAVGLFADTYSVTVTDQNGCSATASVIITQPAPMAVAVSMGDTICPGQSANIGASASGGTVPYTYFWQPNVGFGSSQLVSPGVSTTYTAIVTDANGCTMTGTVAISVHNNNFSLSVNSTPAICAGQSATIAAVATGNTNLNYSWSHTPANTPGPFTVTPQVTTVYSVTATNVCGISVMATGTITVHPVPQVDIPPLSITECERAIIHFTDTNSANSGSTYVWSFGDGTTSTQVSPGHTYYQSGVYVVGVTITSPYGCISSASDLCTITIHPYPNANFTSDPLLKTSIINPNFNFYDQSSNAIKWSWDFGDGQTSALQNPSHTYAQVGVYLVKLITESSGGCMDSITKTVEVKPQFTFYIPNTFTPNGDHINDIFTGKGMEIIEFEMTIYDRWGNKIFETNDLESGWDGRANGGSEIAQQDVYVYQVRLRDFERTQHVYYGHVNLVK